jgi:gluconolactonase
VELHLDKKMPTAPKEFAGKQSMKTRLFHPRLLTLVSLALLPLCAAAQVSATPVPDPQAAAAPITAPAPIPDKPFELHALDPEFWKVFPKNVKLETMGTGFAFTEGPVWDKANFLWVSDEKGNKIDKLYPDGHIETVVSLIDPDGSTYDRQHRLWSTSSGQRAVIEFSPDGKSYEVIADQYQGKKLNTPNDIVMGPDGAMYFTDPIIDLRHDQQQEQPQSIYRLGADHSLTLLTRELLAPNGLAFSPDGKYLYIDDDKTRNIHRYDFHKDGTISGGMVFGTLVDPGSRGNPDGMRVDKHGRLFVSGPNGMWVFNRDGKHLGTVQLPHPMANLAWGGPGYSTLYLTAGKNVYTLQTKTHGFIPYESKK